MLLGGLNNGAKTSKLTSAEEITLHALFKDLLPYILRPKEKLQMQMQ